MIGHSLENRFAQHASSEETGSNRWLVSFSDFMTLLFAFFVVMYSISQVSETKYRVLSDTLQESFSKQYMPGVSSDEETGLPPVAQQWSEATAPEYPEGGSGLLDGGKVLKLDELNEKLYSAFNSLPGDNLASISGNETRLEVNLDADVLFESGSATPSYLAEFVFEEVTRVLEEGANRIEIEGHTDDRPIASAAFPSNWQLSSARASSIVQLLEKFGIDSRRLSATGYGKTKPIAENHTAEGRAENRRVVLVIHHDAAENAPLSTMSYQITGESIEADKASLQVQDNEESNQVGGPQLDPAVQTIQMGHGGLLFTNEDRPTVESRRQANLSQQSSNNISLSDSEQETTGLPELELE